MKYDFIHAHRDCFPVTALCRVMRVSTSAFYSRCRRPAKLIDQEIWQLCQRMKALFVESRCSLGSRQMTAQLRGEGFSVGRYRICRLMNKMGLYVKNRCKYVVTTDSRHDQPVAANWLNRKFNPTRLNQAWTTDITYIWTDGGWVHLAIVMDLYNRQIVGWPMDRHMEVSLASRALMMAINLRQPPAHLIIHSDRGVQYAAHTYQAMLTTHGMTCSMSRKGNCWDNAPTERFFSSLKREWLTGMRYRNRHEAENDVKAYMRYYHSRRPHTILGNQTPLEFGKSA